MKVEGYNVFIGIFLILTLICGVFTGVNFHKGNSDEMFIALIVGFVFLCILYALIEKREELVHGTKVEKY